MFDASSSLSDASSSSLMIGYLMQESSLMMQESSLMIGLMMMHQIGLIQHQTASKLHQIGLMIKLDSCIR